MESTSEGFKIVIAGFVLIALVLLMLQALTQPVVVDGRLPGVLSVPTDIGTCYVHQRTMDVQCVRN